MTRIPVTIALVLALALAALGCGTSKDNTGSTTASASECTPSKLDTHTKGELTVATDDPAYEPYFVDDKPENGKGFESAVAFAIGEQLGFEKAQIKWTTEPFNSSYAPGPKNFDFDVNEISITPVREKAVDFSAPYYTANQAIVAAKDTKAAEAASESFSATTA
jgi:polar amino acid transport system substrate-binding protein